MIPVSMAVILTLSAIEQQKEFNSAYGTHISTIKAKVSAVGEMEAQNKKILSDLTLLKQQMEKSHGKLNDFEVLGTTYRLLYRTYNLGFSSDDEIVRFWKNYCNDNLFQLKESIEKEICRAYFDKNETSWLFDRYPDWRMSSILATICFSNSAYGVANAPGRYDVFVSAYAPSVKEVGATTFRKTGMDLVMSLGSFIYSKDKKYMREYINLLREYAAKTIDKGSAERALKQSSYLEKVHFGLKTDN